MKKTGAVIYLDLLAFKNYVKSDSEVALELLRNFHEVLQFRRQQKPVLVEIQDERVDRLAEQNDIDSFEYFFSLSDSVFIFFSDPNSLVMQLSTWLLDCFLYYKETEYVRGTQYPPLFRGGISYGDIDVFQILAIYNGKECAVPNMIGQSVVQAVSLEQKGLPGPRILCDDEFVKHLSKPANYLRKEAGAWELLWPSFNYLKDSGDERSDRYKLCELFSPALSLWKHFSGTAHEKHYRAFLELIVRSHLAFAECGTDPKLINDYLYQKLNATGLKLCDSGPNSELVFP